MNKFSDQEYHILKTDAAEIRASISRYIGYIITVTGLSGIIKFYFDNTLSGTATLILFFLSLVVLTLLFEVVWYKFKSHNRLIGYIQVLMQEIDAIPYRIIKKKGHWKNKTYLKRWRNYKLSPKKKRLEDFYGWEFAMSRYNSNVLFAKEETEQDRIDSYTDAINKCNYVFSLPKKWMPYTEQMDCNKKDGTPCDRDVEFFEKITLPIYFYDNAFPLRTHFYKYFKFLFSDKAESEPLKNIDVENRYLSYGWEYPRKITQIACIAAFMVYMFLIVFVIKNYDLNLFGVSADAGLFGGLDFKLEMTFPYLAIISSTCIIGFWINRYVKELIELLYGKFSIDYYCWQFFVYRIQMLNSKKLVPVFYSRSYLRYFKCKTYSKFLEVNQNYIEDKLSENKTESDVQRHKSIFKTYREKLNAHKRFDPKEDKEVAEFHNKIKKAIKAKLDKNSGLTKKEKKALGKGYYYNLKEELNVVGF